MSDSSPSELLAMLEVLETPAPAPVKPDLLFKPKEFKLLAMRECVLPPDCVECNSPDTAAHYWLANIQGYYPFDPDVECLTEILLNTRLRPMGHVFVAKGTLDMVVTQPREIFRPAIVGAAKSIVLIHNHPSGDPTPSRGDIKCTQQLCRAGMIVGIRVLDHIVMGKPSAANSAGFSSIRQLGLLKGM